MNILLIIIVGVICGLIGYFINNFIITQQIKKINISGLQQQANELTQQNNQLLADISKHQEIYQGLIIVEADKEKLIQDYNETLTTKKQACELLDQDYTHKQELLDISEAQIKKNEEKANYLYNQQLIFIEQKLDQATLDLSEKFSQAEEDYQSEYLKTMSEASDSFREQLQNLINQCVEQQTILDDLSSKTRAAVEENKRVEEKKIKQDFYRLIIPKADLVEIATLKEIAPKLRDKEALYKVIYKVYYEKPYTDLIGRVLGGKKVCGIYKITELSSQKCYIGQSVDVAARWKQHIKRGVGAETPTRNKLYTAMMDLGVENFSFELIEECPHEKLNEREDYWQEYFQAKEFGYSIK